MLAAMAAALVASLAVPGAFGDEALVFALAYTALRVLHIVIYILGSPNREVRVAIERMAPGFLVFCGLLIVAAGFDGWAQAGLWIAALVVQVVGLNLAGLKGWRVSPAHFAERHGLVVIIALGESIVAIGAGAAGEPLDGPLILAAALGVAAAFALWWAYFDVVALVAQRRLTEATGVARARMARDSYTYLHLPMIAGIVLLALGMKKTAAHTGDELERRRGGGAVRRAGALPARARGVPAAQRAHAQPAPALRRGRPAGADPGRHARPGARRAGRRGRAAVRARGLRGAGASPPPGTRIRHADAVASGAMATGASTIVDLLERAGVEVCFGLPGVHNLALWEALRESPIRLVGVRHEQTAAYAADGYARATGRLGVALTTTGPGAANTLGAVGEAWASRSPILVDRHGHPVGAAPARASTAACCTRPPARRRCSRRWSSRRTWRGSRTRVAPEAGGGDPRGDAPPTRARSTWRSPTDLLAAEVPAGDGGRRRGGRTVTLPDVGAAAARGRCDGRARAR